MTTEPGCLLNSELTLLAIPFDLELSFVGLLPETIRTSSGAPDVLLVDKLFALLLVDFASALFL